MKFICFALLVILSHPAVLAQDPIPSTPENCANGIDDDGDGKIDLNDPECFCSSSLDEFSLLPNPSFELHNCCPVTVSQTVCMENWFQAGYGTTDYLNNCGESMDIAISPTTGEVIDILDSMHISPYPHGDGVVRTVAWNGWTEYLGTCLTTPLAAGTTYQLKMFLASYNVFDPFVVSTAPIDIMIYGAQCYDLPFDGMEPDTSLDVLGQITYYPEVGWVDLECTFTPSISYNAIVFGPEYALDPYYTDHYQVIFYDHLRLSEGSTPSFPEIELSGDPCEGSVQLLASGASNISWFEDGILIAGATSDQLTLPVNYPETTVISVKDNTSKTCAVIDLASLNFSDCLPETALQFPNVVTSNTDGVNDVYLISNLESVASVSFKVINRWGEVVYESDDYLNDWRPSDLHSGVYFYLAEVNQHNGETEVKQGTLQLINE